MHYDAVDFAPATTCVRLRTLFSGSGHNTLAMTNLKATFLFTNETFTTPRACISQQPTDNVPPSQQNLWGTSSPAACLLVAKATRQQPRYHTCMEIYKQTTTYVWHTGRPIKLSMPPQSPSCPPSAACARDLPQGTAPRLKVKMGKRVLGRPKHRLLVRLPAKRRCNHLDGGDTWRQSPHMTQAGPQGRAGSVCCSLCRKCCQHPQCQPESVTNKTHSPQ